MMSKLLSMVIINNYISFPCHIFRVNGRSVGVTQCSGTWLLSKVVVSQPPGMAYIQHIPHDAHMDLYAHTIYVFLGKESTNRKRKCLKYKSSVAAILDRRRLHAFDPIIRCRR